MIPHIRYEGNWLPGRILEQGNKKSPAGHPLRHHPTIVDPSNEIQANLMIAISRRIV